jgi:hypothetical protein
VRDDKSSTLIIKPGVQFGQKIALFLIRSTRVEIANATAERQFTSEPKDIFCGLWG